MFSTQCSNSIGQISCPFKRKSVCRRPYCPFLHKHNDEDDSQISLRMHGNNDDSGYSTLSNLMQFSRSDNDESLEAKDDPESALAANVENEFEKFINKPLNIEKDVPQADKNIAQSSNAIEKSAVKPKEFLSNQNELSLSLNTVNPPINANNQIESILSSSKGIDSDCFYGKKVRIANSPSKKLVKADKGFDEYDENNDDEYLYSLKGKANIKNLTRIKIVRKLQQEYAKIGAGMPVKAGQMAEADFFEQSANKHAYVHSCMKFIVNIRKNVASADFNKADKRTTSSNLSENCKKESSVVSTKKKPKIATHGENLFEKFKFEDILSLIASLDELAENGYPVLNSKDKSVSIRNNNYNKDLRQGQMLGDNDEVCIRCHKVYTLIESLDSANPLEFCCYHSEKLSPSKTEKTYKCCQQSKGSTGCKIAPYHVCNGTTDTSKFSKIFDGDLFINADMDFKDLDIYALDCEMVYTTVGSELARLSVVDKTLRTVIDMIVKPANEIIDCNTDYSGLTKEMISSSNKTLLDAKNEFKQLLNKSKNPPILVGHSLENDLIALQTYYYNVIDTSLVFTPVHGNFKYQLKRLAQTHLNKLAQAGVGGHDSVEDSIIAMELVVAKLKALANKNS